MSEVDRILNVAGNCEPGAEDHLQSDVFAERARSAAQGRINSLHAEPELKRLSPQIRSSAGAFATTHWSVVLRVGQNEHEPDRAALEEICLKYWYPLYVFVRRRGIDTHEAADLTQDFFAMLLEKETIQKVDRQKGKFRTFLLAALNNFLNNEWDKRQTRKRGGQTQIIPLDPLVAEKRYHQELADPITPERLFERRWALTLLEQALVRLRQGYVVEGKAALFAKLEPGLTGELAEIAHTDWAAALGMSRGAVKMALHRMRRRFGEALREEIARTVSAPDEVDEEIRNFFAIISS